MPSTSIISHTAKLYYRFICGKTSVLLDTVFDKTYRESRSLLEVDMITYMFSPCYVNHFLLNYVLFAVGLQ